MSRKRRYTTGDVVTTTRFISGVNVPDIPAGSRGTVVTTTAFTKRPRRVHFLQYSAWGPKSFITEVASADIE